MVHAVTEETSEDFSIVKAKELAEKEVKEEKFHEAKRKIKQKLKAIEDAERVVRNLKRELEDLYVDISG